MPFTRVFRGLQTKRVSRSLGGNIMIGLFLLLIGAFTVLPIVFVVISSFKPLSELFLYPPRFFVTRPTMENYFRIFTTSHNMLVPTERYIFNSIFTSVAATISYIFMASLAAYPLSRKFFPGKQFVKRLIVLAILFRPEVIQIPQYLIFSKLKMVDTPWVLIIPAISGSFGVFLMQQFMFGVPNEIVESARIDGAGEWRIYFSLIMPMIKPAWLTLIIFTFQSIWNTSGLQYIYKENLKTLPTALNQLTSSGLSMAGVSSAVAVFLMLPPLLMFIFAQGNVLETMAHSGLKN